MDGFVETLQSALGRREGVIAVSAPADGGAFGASMPRQTSDRSVARELASSLDRATELGEWELAERIAAQAIRVARDHPLLAERIARLRATRADFDSALAIIDSCCHKPSSMRLLRCVCLLQLGRMHEAHADLLGWARRSTAPLPARLILGLLEWNAGHHDDAAIALQHNLHQLEDPWALTALMLMATAQDRRNIAEFWSSRLRESCHSHPHCGFFEAALVAAGFARSPARMVASASAAATLATELLAAERLIPALVESQRLSADRQMGLLLAEAIEGAFEDLDDQHAASVALSELHDRLGDADLAQAWRARAQGLRRDDVLASIGRDGVNTSTRSAIAARRQEAA